MNANNQEKALEQFLEALLELDITKIEANQEIKNKVSYLINLLDSGKIKVVNKDESGEWIFNSALKKSILLFIKLSETKKMKSDNIEYYDKIEQKFNNWSEEKIKNQGIRYLKGTSVRHGAFIGKQVVIIQSFVNIGAYIGDGTMLDSFSSIGSCAYIGKNCHISANTVIAGTLEPEQSSPVIIEDNCFIGANCSISEGVIVGEGSVIGSGTNITASTKIIDPNGEEIKKGIIPKNSVVVPGYYQDAHIKASTACVIIKKYADNNTRKKTKINEILRN